MSYVHEDKSRLQITRSETSFECFWTPKQYFGDCVRCLHTAGFLAFKEASFNAEFSDGRKIATQNWKPALEQVAGRPDEDFRYIEFSSSHNRAILVASLSADQQLDIGLKAELELTGALRGALFLTSAPRTVKVAWNRIVQELFPRKYKDLCIRI
ncbi:MAG: hypothetical protein NVSMB39_2610 [Candidatus Saccharimonadales bacterium]